MSAYLEYLKLSSYTLNEISVITAVIFSVYVVSLASYRLYFSPLARFPGRKLAALTQLYEFYYDYIRRGKYQWELEDMHAKYGMLNSLRMESCLPKEPTRPHCPNQSARVAY